MRTILSVIVSAAVCGCATVGADKVEQIKPGMTLAPISLMGDTLALRQVGTTVFHNDERDIDVANWRIDRHTESIAGTVVAGKGKFKVTQADSGEVRKNVRLPRGFGPLTALAKRSEADYVLLIGPAPMADPFMGTNQKFSGYGIYQRSFVLRTGPTPTGAPFMDTNESFSHHGTYQRLVVGMKRAVNFLTMRAILLNGKSGEEVARTECALSAPRQDSEWLEAKKGVQPNEGTRADIEKLLEGALRKCLAALKLG